jgi:hypothetical protein
MLGPVTSRPSPDWTVGARPLPPELGDLVLPELASSYLDRANMRPHFSATGA